MKIQYKQICTFDTVILAAIAKEAGVEGVTEEQFRALQDQEIYVDMNDIIRQHPDMIKVFIAAASMVTMTKPQVPVDKLPDIEPHIHENTPV